MWQELINFINNDPAVGGIITSFLGNTLYEPISEGLKKLFKKKHDEKELTVDGCKQLGIKEEDLVAILNELNQLKNKRVVISQENEEGKNDSDISGIPSERENVLISQTNKKGDNNLKISF